MSSVATTLDSSTSPPLMRAIALGGLAVGVLDALDGVAYFGLTAGNHPIQVQYIASGATRCSGV